MTNLITQIKQSTLGLPDNKARNLEAAFLPMIDDLKAIEDNYNIIVGNQNVTKEVTQKARELRLEIRSLRIRADKARKTEKADIVRAGNAVQAIYNLFAHQIIPKEERLAEIENYFLIKHEQEVRELGNTRLLQLQAIEKKYDGKLSDLPSIDELGLLDETNWLRLFKGTEADIAEVVALEQAEKQRQEEERNAQALLAEEREKQLNIEREKRADAEKKLAAINAKRDKEEAVENENKQKHQDFLNNASDVELVSQFIVKMTLGIHNAPKIKDTDKLQAAYVDCQNGINKSLTALLKLVALNQFVPVQTNVPFNDAGFYERRIIESLGDNTPTTRINEDK